MGLEVELKLAADGDAPLRELADADALGRAQLGPPERFDEVDRYLDTPDRRFAAARWACRLRRRDGRTRITLKGSAASGSGAGLHRRPEVEGPATDALDPATWPASEARDFVDRLRAGGPLIERFRLVQQRTERSVAVDGDRIGTLTLDVVGVEADGTPRGTLHAVELELLTPTPRHQEVLDELAVELRAVAGLRPDRRTKLEHALALIGGR